MQKKQLPDEWFTFSAIWFHTCRRFGYEITHHALAVAMHKADGGAQGWEHYLARAQVECQRQWDLEDPCVQQGKALHERRGDTVFAPTETGWEIRVFNYTIWRLFSLKAWLRDFPGETAEFYEADAHLTPAQRRAEWEGVQ